jgi:hypothetical protein
MAATNEHLDAYRATGNAVHFWCAWLILRKSGIGVTEPMLRKVDSIAQRLCSAKGQRAIAEAVDMTRAKGAGRGAVQADAYMHRRAVVTEVWQRACKATGATPQPGLRPRVPASVMREVAARNGLTEPALKMQWSRWWKEKAAADRAAVYEQMAAALRPQKR